VKGRIVFFFSYPIGEIQQHKRGDDEFLFCLQHCVLLLTKEIKITFEMKRKKGKKNAQ
jgi:hypothetical protein